MMKQYLAWSLVIFCIAGAVGVEAQQPTKVPRIGYLTARLSFR